ncbi:MAG TPA: hypothetical protein VG101_08465 [Puia sp.]|jgi:hypothetical protein|nr:hypothetical protein [Puia sp.]
MMNRTYSTLFFLLAAGLLLTLLYCPPVDIPLDDKEVFRYGGWDISRGGIPYRDFFDHKPPLIYFLYFLAHGSWGLWLIDLALVLSATAVFFQTCVKHKLPFPWLLPLLFNLMLRDFLICGGIGMTREYSTIFQLIFFCVLIGRSRYRDILAGLLTGLIFFMQQDQALFLIPFLLYSWMATGPRSIPVRFLRYIAGFGVILVPLLLYFLFTGSLGYFWADAFQFNFSWYTTERKSLGDHFRTIKHTLDAGNYELPFMIALTLGISAFFFRNRKRGLVMAGLVGLLLSFSSELLGARPADVDFSYYFVTLSASVPILLFTVFAFGEDPVVSNPKAQMIFGLLLCCSLTYTVLQHATHLIPRNDRPFMRQPALIWLREHRPADYQLYTVGNTGFVYAYNEFGIECPSRWIYQQFWKWYDRWDADGSILRSIGDDLVRHKTRYIWMDSAEVTRFRNPANYTWWMSFLKSHYRLVPSYNDPRSELWEWKGD